MGGFVNKGQKNRNSVQPAWRLRVKILIIYSKYSRHERLSFIRCSSVFFMLLGSAQAQTPRAG
jgi:hypothetical protein